ncbi:phosphate ABC transporter permease PstA [Kushneria aurantia]|uniref:Phosphate transport system permease protein PstA n=1 Tax=Kushneria aurantia TaxID=504092 RepID=A0ABV6G2B3_9GAMM|nr:phosphate ABC transporter permease PstA [Kushneria aurantia]
MAQSFDDITKQLGKRHRRTRRLKLTCMAAMVLSAVFLVVFLGDMVNRGWSAFQQGRMQIEVSYTEQSQQMPLTAVDEQYRQLVSRGFFRQIPQRMEADPELLGTTRTQWVIARSSVDQYLKGRENSLSEQQRQLIDRMVEQGNAKLAFNTTFFTTGDSRMAELAGILSAALGTLLTIIVTMAICFPIGVMTAVYLEEFAPDNRFTRLIEVNINNLAAVPSILFGLLGLAIFISFFGVPRSSPLVGGLTLSLMTLPMIIISTRAALRSVPDSIRHAAFGVGCTRWQVVSDHVLPVSIPGILTGSIIGLAQAMGETAPLIIVGMVAFMPDPSFSLTQAATVLPAQVYSWASLPNQAFQEKTAGGILVLLAVLITLNAAAVLLRNRFERRW